MIIRSSQVALTANHTRAVEHTRVERLRLWSDRQAGRPGALPSETAGPSARAVPGAPATPAGPAAPTAPAVRAVPATRAVAVPIPDRQPPQPHHGPHRRLAAGETASASASRENLVASGKLGVLIALIERLTGRKVEVIDPAVLEGSGQASADATALAQQLSAAGGGQVSAQGGQVGWGLDYHLVETTAERENTTFTATARVTTADGRRLDVAVDLGLHRESVETTEVRVLAGDAARPQVTDPLVLSRGAAPSLSGGTVDVDLDSDGTAETVSFVGSGSAFLALDRNGNGRVDDGSELFGPTSGDGFAELASFDDDGNGWIDEADAVYSRLRLWSEAAGPLTSLADAGVGAIGLARVTTPFEFTEDGETTGLLRSSGIWLAEDGSAGTVHQIDLAT